MILAIDLGTTHWKAALITDSGEISRVSRIPTPVVFEDGFPCYAAEAVKQHLRELLANLGPLPPLSAVALTGMAEAGLLVERGTLRPLSSVWPWFDRRALPVFESTRGDFRFADRPAVTGLPDSYKYGIYKLLTLMKTGKYDPDRTAWMGLVSYAAGLLTGACAEDVSLAARTGCLDIHTLRWDEGFLNAIGLRAGMFPRLIRPGEEAGMVSGPGWGIPRGTPVCIGGHDHLCAAYGMGASDQVFLSAGTAQVLLGPAWRTETGTGLSYGPTPGAAPYACLGSIQSAGGSVNYWKRLLYSVADYEDMMQEADTAPVGSGLLWFPYLSGSGAPHLNPDAGGGLIGLRDGTDRGAIIAAVYEGLAFETRYLAEAMRIPDGAAVYCSGGLTLHRRYMRTLANVLKRPVLLPVYEETALYGAARLALCRLGLPGLPDAPVRERLEPDPAESATLERVYLERYLPMMRLVTKPHAPSGR